MEYAEDSFYIKELLSNGCCCGRTKEPGEAFCFGCRKTLGHQTLIALSENVISDGYKTLYECAVGYLQNNTDRLI